MSFADEHDELRDLAARTPPATLSPEDVARMLLHADQCGRCAAVLRNAAALAVLAQIPMVRLDPKRTVEIRRRLPTRAKPARPLRALWQGSGWLAAAAMAVALVTHHGFHEPLRSGWLVAAALALSSFGLGVYALAQRKRIARLVRSRDGGAER